MHKTYFENFSGKPQMYIHTILEIRTIYTVLLILLISDNN